MGCVVWGRVLVAALLGAPPPCPLFACQRRERSEAFRGRRRAKPSDNGMSGLETRKPVKDSIYLRHAPKWFSLWSLRGFFLTRQKEISQKWFAEASPLQSFYKGLRPYNIAPRPSGPRYASKRSLARRYASTRSVAGRSPGKLCQNFMVPLEQKPRSESSAALGSGIKFALSD